MMIRELLVALSGIPGAIFLKDSEDGDALSISHLFKQLPNIHQSETEQIDKILVLGTCYIRIQKCLDEIDKYDQPDLYVNGLISAVNDELSEYRSKLVHIEEEYLRDSYLSLTHITYRLHDYFSVLPTLEATLRNDIFRKQVSGCMILEVFYKKCTCGNVAIERCMQRMLHKCHCILYRQLSVWLLYGKLPPQSHGDGFFIKPRDQRQREEEVRSSSRAVPAEDESDTSPRPLPPSRGGVVEFSVDLAMLPAHIPHTLADTILFVGESVHLLHSRPHTPAGDNMTQGNAEHDAADLKHETEFVASMNQLLARGGGGGGGSGGSDDDARFDIHAMECCVQMRREYVSQRLWSLLVVESGLLHQLSHIRDVYLLGRGDLFTAFIEQASTLLDHTAAAAPAAKSVITDANAILEEAARDILMESDTLVDNFQFVVDKSKDMSSGSTGWDMLHLDYQVSWPLHVIFTPAVISRYNEVFHLLLLLRRSQMALHSCWLEQRQREREEAVGGGTREAVGGGTREAVGGGTRRSPRHARTLTQLTHHMSFLVSNLRHYIMVSVIEGQYSLLVEKVTSESCRQEFEVIQHAHDSFLTTVMSHCFLFNKPMYKNMSSILELGMKLSKFSHDHFTAPQLDITAHSHLVNIIKMFGVHTELLFKSLHSLDSKHKHRQLIQLILMLDYNKYVTRRDGRLGL